MRRGMGQPKLQPPDKYSGVCAAARAGRLLEDVGDLLMKKRTFLIAAMLMTLLWLPGCTVTSDEVKAEGKRLEKVYSDSFKAQAKEEYGANAKVSGIGASYYILRNSPFRSGYRFTDGTLNGKITVGKESFYAKYIVDENSIISPRNYDKIIDSLGAYFSYLELDIVGGRIVNSARNTWYLPERFQTFEDMLLDERHMNTVVLTASEIGHLTKEDFSALNIIGSLTFVQISDQTEIDELLKYTFRPSESISFTSYRYPTITVSGQGRVDAFDYFHIRNAVYVSDSSIPSFNYMTKLTVNADVKEYRVLVGEGRLWDIGNSDTGNPEACISMYMAYREPGGAITEGTGRFLFPCDDKKYSIELSKQIVPYSVVRVMAAFEGVTLKATELLEVGAVLLEDEEEFLRIYAGAQRP